MNAKPKPAGDERRQPQRGGLFVEMELKHPESSVGAT